MSNQDFFAMYGNEIIILSIMSLLFLSIPRSRKILFPKNTKSLATPSSRLGFVDFAKGVSILAVIVIHVCFILLNNSLSGSEETVLHSINNISRFAIAVFFICSAILQKPMEKYDGYLKFLLKKIRTLYLPYIIVSIFLTSLSNKDWLTSIEYILSGQASVPFYFIVVLFQFHLIYPLLEKYRNKKWFLGAAFVVSLASFLLPKTWYLLKAVLFFKFLFFFCYGLVIKEKIINGKLPLSHPSTLLLTFFVYLGLFTVFPTHLYNVRLVYGVMAFHALYFLFNKMNFQLCKNFFIYNGKISLWLFLLHFGILEIIYYIPFFRQTNIYLSFFTLLITDYILTLLLALSLSKLYKKFLAIALPPKHHLPKQPS